MEFSDYILHLSRLNRNQNCKNEKLALSLEMDGYFVQDYVHIDTDTILSKERANFIFQWLSL